MSSDKQKIMTDLGISEDEFYYRLYLAWIADRDWEEYKRALKAGKSHMEASSMAQGWLGFQKLQAQGCLSLQKLKGE